MSIQELLVSGANVAITVTPKDLKEFSLSLINEVLSMKNDEPTEQYLTTDETAQRLGVTTNTLWRWDKTKYLCPVRVGRRPVYRLSDITKLMEGRR
jgi:predicted DNA-binding transcriptional regulator AlpA